MASQTYRDRNKILEGMGYKDYKEYLVSPLWKEIREKVFSAKGRICTLCPEEASTIHHRGYRLETMTGDDLSALVPICTRCHDSIEFKVTGVKRSFKEVEATFNSRLGKYKRSFAHASTDHKKTLHGYCKVCGKRAVNKTRYCRPHTPVDHRPKPIVACVLCKDAPARPGQKWCTSCLWKVLAKREAGLGGKWKKHRRK